ncbi:MAG: DUF805 domain-containing protein [Burkholderiaceae bacterium]|jgi:uncharacterized membrane protein YhaH (DUF805 family)|nr:DUF805 domain-containing protein [Burkholderiaceae bacterium]
MVKEHFIMGHFMDAIVHHYADYRGRATRREFCFFILFYFAIYIVIIMMDIFVLTGLGETDGGHSGITLAKIYWWATLLPATAISARRLHDMGQSGWMQLAYMIPLLGLTSPAQFDKGVGHLDSFLLVLLALFFACMLGATVLVMLAVTDSQKGSNRYGPNPKESGEVA